MPPLRTRQGDLIRFAGHYLKHFAAQCGRRIEGLSDPADAILRTHGWPGNLRELRNAIERAVILARSDKLEPGDFPAEVRETAQGLFPANHDPVQIGSMMTLEQLEEAHLRKVLERITSKTEAAQVLGIDQATLYRKRKKLGLE